MPGIVNRLAAAIGAPSLCSPLATIRGISSGNGRRSAGRVRLKYWVMKSWPQASRE
jgi:hypothetical protein